MAEIKRLPEPASVSDAKVQAEEVLSAWLVDRNEVAATFLPALHGPDLGNWGRLLADVARFIAHAHAEKHGGTEADALATLRVEFDDQVMNVPRAIRLKTDVPRDRK